MIKHIKLTEVYVTDQNEALRFYTEKLGFEIRADVTFGDYRWLTVGLKDQPELELALTPLKPTDRLTEEDVAVLRRLLQEGKLSGFLLRTEDIYNVFEQLKAKGIEFLSEPTMQPYGLIEAVMKDNSGNWFSLQQEVEEKVN